MDDMNAIFQLRSSAGLSQEALAKAVGVSQSAISQIERGEKSPSVDLAIRLVSLAKEHNQRLSLEDIYASKEIANAQ